MFMFILNPTNYPFLLPVLDKDFIVLTVRGIFGGLPRVRRRFWRISSDSRRGWRDSKNSRFALDLERLELP